eukprot:3459530-Pleurochrysis_carterae.AAC.1
MHAHACVDERVRVISTSPTPCATSAGVTWCCSLYGARRLARRHAWLGWLQPCAPLMACVVAAAVAANW